MAGYQGRKARSATADDAPARRRRANREGSIYHVPSEDRWRAALTWTDAAGRQQRRVVSGKTQDAVRSRLTELRADLEHGLEPVVAGTVTAFLTGWLEREKQRVRPSTWRGRHHHVQAYIVPALGALKLDKLTPGHVERMTAAMIDRGLTPRTASHVRVTLRRAMADAQRDGLVHRNVAALARPPRVTPRTLEPGLHYFDAKQLRRLLAVAAEYDIGALVTVAATTGLRRGELLGLSWDDIDWTVGTLTVRRSLARAWGRGYELSAPKTNRSRRTIHLADPAIEALRREERAQDAARDAAGSPWQNTDRLVFTDAIGRPLSPDAVHVAYHALRDAAGLPSVPFHGLRHSTATALLSAGVPLRVVSDLLGHSGIAITADYYAHVEQDLRRDAADAMNRALGGAS
ncbi:MAG: site-specific integrase [Chloroflexi bacterium]|nr:site-specific integrase [Chloroflexota bacterium]